MLLLERDNLKHTFFLHIRYTAGGVLLFVGAASAMLGGFFFMNSVRTKKRRETVGMIATKGMITTEGEIATVAMIATLSMIAYESIIATCCIVFRCIHASLKMVLSVASSIHWFVHPLSVCPLVIRICLTANGSYRPGPLLFVFLLLEFVS